METDGTTPTTVKMPNVSICNLKPVNDVDKAEEFKATVESADTEKTQITFSYPKNTFKCWKTPTPPNPPTPPPNPSDKNIGKACAKADDTCGNTGDDTKYCCGIASEGKQVDNTGSTIDKGP